MTTLTAVFVYVSIQLGLPPGLLSSVCYVESHHNPRAIALNDGKGDSLGACQVKFTTARLRGYKGTPGALYRNVKTNVYWAGKVLAFDIRRYHGNLYQAVGAYNRGTYRAGANKEYIDKVFDAWGTGR